MRLRKNMIPRVKMAVFRIDNTEQINTHEQSPESAIDVIPPVLRTIIYGFYYNYYNLKIV